ncbi:MULTISPECIES: adenine-specific DNA-methyltransferase [Pseudomonas]|jgi:site-specific DNA-methyltransferase (adenine-specific)/adenine-specific DNA-methyltransferase|uniref:Methyltransferase n=1 Tax=Pseudomonas mosselii TaxID=78327 RepID=A0A5R8YN46_9PSED|nr:adenine-specific DNA-methyltransferase [Pseudomonas mosselii]TLP54898.1 adenine-specific DNA-methyltransferase [Pseudomonas mosselii]
MTKQYSHDGHTIYHGEAVEVLKSIETASIDLIFADPPYNIGKDFDGIHDRIDESEYFSWCWQWIDECSRILKPNGTFYLMNSTQNMPHLDIYCRKQFEILSRIIWAYDSSGVQAKKFFGSLYEPILHLVKNPKSYTFNANDILVEAKTGAKRGLMDYRKNPPQPYNTTKVPGNVWEFPRVRFKMDEYENHPSQKPESLLERVIRASSNPGEVVLDPFGGSFSTGAVAKRLGRRSISIEKNETYIKIGLRRIGIPSDYSDEELLKHKARKTQNLSKKQRTKESAQQPIFQLEL